MLDISNDLNTYLLIGAFLFASGFYGLLQRRSLIGMLISSELILAGASLNFMAFNRFLAPNPSVGQIFTLFIMGIAAAEAAIGLAIIVAYYRNTGTVHVEDIDSLKG